MSSEGGKEEPHGSKDTNNTMAKTAGFVVFSGIAMSILKALNPFNPQHSNPTASCRDSTPTLIQKPISPPLPKDPTLSARTVQIVKGDTLWGLSKKYGVSIDAIKEANGMEGDTIYAGKKLVIP